MASKLVQLRTKASQASQAVAKHANFYYKELLEENKHFIQHPPAIEKCDLLAKQLFATRLASIPGRYEAFWKELGYVKNLWKNRHELKIEDAGIAALFGLSAMPGPALVRLWAEDLHSRDTTSECNRLRSRVYAFLTVLKS